MKLKISDMTEILNVSEKTIYRWIKSGKIPAYKINGQYRFSDKEIDKWISENKMINKVEEKIDDAPINLPILLKKGGIYEIEVENENVDIEELIKIIVNTINLPSNINKSKLIEQLIEREEMLSTGIGNGIAIPHTREHIIDKLEDERVILILLKNSIFYNSLDGEKIHTMFLVLSCVQKRHIELLAKISFLSRNSEFVKMLKGKEKENIIEFIKFKKSEWDERMGRVDNLKEIEIDKKI